MFAEHLVLRATEHLLPALLDVLHDELPKLVDDRDGVQVRLAMCVAPSKEAMAAEYDAIALWVVLHRAAQHHGEFEAGALPRDPDHAVTKAVIELFHLLQAVCCRGHCN